MQTSASQNFPQNGPYMRTASSDDHISSLHQRIQDLEEQLSSLANALSQQPREGQSLVQQNEQMRLVLESCQITQESLRSQIAEKAEENRLLRESLLKQNEEMEELHRSLRSNHYPMHQAHDFEDKINELNDEISNLLVKIQELVNQNNDQADQHQQLLNQVKQMQEENLYLKEQMHQVQELSIAQQNQMQDKYLKELTQLTNQLEKTKNQVSRANNQMKINEKQGDSLQVEQLIAQVQSLREELLQSKEIQKTIRKKYEQQMATLESEATLLSSELSTLRSRVRQGESASQQLQFMLQQQQEQQKRLQYYRQSYSNLENKKHELMQLRTQNQQLISRLTVAESRYEQKDNTQIYHSQWNQEKKQYQQRCGQLQAKLDEALEEVRRNREAMKQLKQLSKNYEEDYRKLVQQYESILSEKRNTDERIISNQTELARHQQIYQQLVEKYYQNTANYSELEKKVRQLEAERRIVPAPAHNSQILIPNYNKENIALIQLQNSALSQQVSQLKTKLEETIQSKAQLLLKYESSMKKIIEQVTKNEELQEEFESLRRQISLQRKQFQSQRNQWEVEYRHYQSDRSRWQQQGRMSTNAEIKKLQVQIVSLQRQMMESEVEFKQQLSSSDDELNAAKLQNQHHRAKIQQLLQQVVSQRNSIDHSHLSRKLQLLELKLNEQQTHLEHKQHLINELSQQLAAAHSRNTSHIITHRPSTTTPRRDLQQNNLLSSRYDELLREKQEMRQQFQQSQLVIRSQIERSEGKDRDSVAATLRQERQGILERLKLQIQS